MLLEEAAHILAPKLGHDFIRHDEALTAKLKALAASLGEKPGDARCEADAVLRDREPRLPPPQ